MLTGGVRHQAFGTRHLAPRDRFEYWRSWFSQAVDCPMRLDPVTNPAPDFASSAEIVSADDVDLIELHCASAIGTWQQEEIAASGRLRLVLLAPTPAGAGWWHGQDVSLAHGAVAFLGRTDGRWRAPGGLRTIQVNVPRTAIPASDDEVERMNDQELLRGDPVFRLLVRPALTSAAGHLGELSGTSGAELGALWISLLTMLVQSLTRQDRARARSVLARRVQAEQYIRDNLADPQLNPSTVATALHLSRRSLYAEFSTSESGVATQIRRARLEKARELLNDPANKQPIVEIGRQVGLPDPSHFSRLFRTRYGCSPRQMRAHPDQRTCPPGSSSDGLARRPGTG